MMKSRLLNRSFACLLLLALFKPTWAITLSDLYIFGDSLSDTFGTIDGGSSNGPLWPFYLSPQMGITYDPAKNFAVTGAVTSHLATQISTYQSTVVSADPNALYVVWAGGNDIIAGAPGSFAANNVISAVNTLASLGASQFLVPNMPDMGLVPIDGAGSLTGAAIDFNTVIDSEYVGSATVTVVDVFGLHHEVINDPTAFGLVDPMSPCLFLGTGCGTDPTVPYLFYDLLHPTTIGHSILADQFSATLAAVPLPPTAWFLGSGLMGIMVIARRRKA
jgi:phospholipase/lecithinase/hemolysin